jgi:ectoine hydroxylase-related dioxygenase (phytanoyl-CoA dioxygenase family)
VNAAGFSVHPRIFTAAEMHELSAALASAPLERSRAGARHILKVPPVLQLARDPRMLALAREWLGDEAQPFKATLFDKSPESNWLAAWHQDTSLPLEQRVERTGYGPWSEKYGVWYAQAPAAALEGIVALRVHLDDSNADNGPLRVLPGTHSGGVLSDAAVGELAQRIEPVACLAPRGAVVAMRPLLVHASSKVASDAPRRVLHLEYSSSLVLGDGLRLRAA